MIIMLDYTKHFKRIANRHDFYYNSIAIIYQSTTQGQFIQGEINQTNLLSHLGSPQSLPVSAEDYMRKYLLLVGRNIVIVKALLFQSVGHRQNLYLGGIIMRDKTNIAKGVEIKSQQNKLCATKFIYYLFLFKKKTSSLHLLYFDLLHTLRAYAKNY